jgi:DNA primase
MDDRIAEHSESINGNITFDEIRLPEGARLITEDDTKYVDYLANRSLAFNQYNFMITPDDKFRNKNRIIIPYTNNNKVVGYTSRFLDDNIPKYLNEQQQGYIFGLDLQSDKWKYAIVVEGILDAVSISGFAVMHNRISYEQAQQLKKLHKKVIVVPDHDKPGLKLIEDAIKYNFNVSIPKWDDDIKDVNDAVVKNGKIPTLLDIIKNSMSPLKVQLFEKNKLRDKIERLQ